MGSPTLLMRPEARFEAVDDGLLVLTHRGDALLEGTGLKPWVDAVRPLLDGSRDRDQIVSRLPASQAAPVGRLIDRLLRLGAVRETDREDETVPADEGERFVAYFRSGAAAAHDRFLRTRTAVVGAGDLAAALQEACERAGLLEVVGAEPSALREAGLVLHVLRSRDDESAGPVSRWCADHGARLVQLVHEDGGTWFSSPETRSDTLPGLLAVLGRLDPVVGSRAARPGTTGSAARVVAARVVHESMRWICGIADPSPSGPRVVRLDDEDLTSTTHRVVPVPVDADVVGSGSGDAAVSAEQFALAAGQVMDSRTGLIDEVVEGALSQLPLNRSSTAARIPTPAGVRRIAVSGVGVGFEEARHAAALQALARYALGVAGQDVEDARAARLAGRDPLTGETVEVPAAQVVEEGDAERVLGLSAGLSGSAALETAVAQQVVAALTTGLTDRSVDVRPVAWDQQTDPRLPYLAAMLDALGEPPAVVEVARAAGPRGIGLHHEGAVTALAWRASPVDALVEAMTARLAAFQEHLDLWPDGSPPPLVPVTQVSADATPGRALGVPGCSPEEALRAMGGRWLWVGLGQDPAVAALTPHVGRLIREVSDA